MEREEQRQTNLDRLVEAGVLDPDPLTEEQIEMVNGLDLHEVQTLMYVAEQIGTVDRGSYSAWLI